MIFEKQIVGNGNIIPLFHYTVAKADLRGNCTISFFRPMP